MRIVAEMEASSLDFAFRSTFYKLLKDMIHKNPFLYERFYHKEKTLPKPFAFAPVLPPKEERLEDKERGIIIPLSPVRLYISTHDPDLALLFEERFEELAVSSEIDPIEIGTHSLKVKSVRILKERVEGDEFRVRIPTLIVNHKRYSTLTDFFRQAGLELEAEKVRPFYTYHKIRGSLIKYKTYDVSGWIYPINDKGKRLVRRILLSGLGWRASQGYGFVFPKQEARGKIVEYYHRQTPVVEKQE